MEIVVYNELYKEQWDDFVKTSKNGTFLLCRDFIEYHRDRFLEFSFMFFDSKGRLLAVMPGHVENKVYYTHQGLTYGGLVIGSRIGSTDVLRIFEHLKFVLRQQGFDKVVYRAIPHIYHRQPAEEDLYALFRCGAVLSERKVSSSINLKRLRIPYSTQRRRSLKKSKSNGLCVNKENTYADFWDILAENLQTKYAVTPVHSLDEIEYLVEKFPDNIHLFIARGVDGVLFGGCVLFETDTVVHVQYVAATENGKRLGAVDSIIDNVVNNELFANKSFFDYGISTEEGGAFLNEKLIYQKEGFGARATLYDIYEIIL